MKKETIDTWVFDLDNTLYPPSVRLFDQIEAKMEAYITRELGISLEAARTLRAEFWRDYGTTLAGLIEVHGIDPDPYLDEVHDIDHSALAHATDLRAALRDLGGRRIIYTNGSRKHAEGVTAALGIQDCFDAMFGIEDSDYKPKPQMQAFERVFTRASVDPKRAVMFEDDPRNLKAPFELGMQTVLVTSDLASDVTGDHIQHRTSDLAGFLSRL